MKKIYLDHAAATPVDERVAARIVKSQRVFGNASSLHSQGKEAKKLLEESRQKVARIIGVSAPEIIFTSSGTESDNLALFGVARTLKKGHIVVSKIEHMAVLRAAGQLEDVGFQVTYLPVKNNGIVDPAELAKALRKDTILVSIMCANNEIGTIQPIAKIAKAVRNFEKQNGTKIVFHTDACQAAGALDINVQKLGVDLMTLNGSKIYGPKGTGCLFVRRGFNIEPLTVGGSQEMGRRAGTENVPLLAGFAMALQLADKNRIKESARLIKLRDHLIASIIKTIPGSRLNGDEILRLPNNINISFSSNNPTLADKDGASGEMLVLALDQKGIEVSTGSACTTSETGPSHVLKAIGVKDANLRITLGRSTTKKDLDYFLKVLPGIVTKLKR